MAMLNNQRVQGEIPIVKMLQTESHAENSKSSSNDGNVGWRAKNSSVHIICAYIQILINI